MSENEPFDIWFDTLKVKTIFSTWEYLSDKASTKILKILFYFTFDLEKIILFEIINHIHNMRHVKNMVISDMLEWYIL